MNVPFFDSTTPAAIHGVPLATLNVAYYLDGRYQWTAAQIASFDGFKVPITVLGDLSAHVYDIESGDGTPAQGAGWCLRKIALGQRPTLYASKSSWAECVTALAAVKVPLAAVDWWAADPTGMPHLVPGSAATQYAWGKEGTYDTSWTDGVWPGTLAPMPPKPPVVAIIDRPGFTSPDQYWIVAADGGVFSMPAGVCPFYGSLGGKQLSAPIVDAVAQADGLGYRLVGSDGAVYDFGSAEYEGGTNT